MKKKAGFVTIIGKPNSGKSSILNAVVGQDISIVTSKPQTTRNKVFGIYTKEDIQIVLLDTPGVLDPKYTLQKFMKREIDSSFQEADIILLVIDCSAYARDEAVKLVERYRSELNSRKSFCVLNKIDLLRKEEVLSIIKDVSEIFSFQEIIPVSAVTGFNIQELTGTIVKHLPECEFYFDPELVTSQPERFFVEELIRAQALQIYRQEVPFSVFVEVEEFKERERGKFFIRANIVLEKESQKSIVIGNKGRMIKLLGQRSRKAIEEFLGHGIFLELFVKVRKNWKKDEDFLKKKFKAKSSTQ